MVDSQHLPGLSASNPLEEFTHPTDELILNIADAIEKVHQYWNDERKSRMEGNPAFGDKTKPVFVYEDPICTYFNKTNKHSDIMYRYTVMLAKPNPPSSVLAFYGVRFHNSYTTDQTLRHLNLHSNLNQTPHGFDRSVNLFFHDGIFSHYNCGGPYNYEMRETCMKSVKYAMQHICSSFYPGSGGDFYENLSIAMALAVCKLIGIQFESKDVAAAFSISVDEAIALDKWDKDHFTGIPWIQ